MADTKVEELLQSVRDQLQHLIRARTLQSPAIIGIRSGGIWVAEQLRACVAKLSDYDFGELDISFYRDDFSRVGLHPQVRPSKIDFPIDGRHVLLVDDVIQTGRTIRAAMNEVFDYGRPASITLICLLELSGRELPIQPDIAGQQLILSNNERIKLVTEVKPPCFQMQTLDHEGTHAT